MCINTGKFYFVLFTFWCAFVQLLLTNVIVTELLLGFRQGANVFVGLLDHNNSEYQKLL